jgi:DNA-binding winged helix-turn-helix (wHTH) protein
MNLAFADCVLNTSSRLLYRGGVAVPLEPKMYALLEVLVERRPAVVSNAELDELLWPKVYVARTSLTRLVSELRAVLGDSPGESRIIRTVYKTGYAFACNVTVSGTAPRRWTGLFLEWSNRQMFLADGENLLGRGAECSLVVDAETVSRRHARISISSETACIEDLNSTNGTFVNGQPVSSATRLKDGDEVSLGTAAMRFRISDRSALTVRSTRE